MNNNQTAFDIDELYFKANNDMAVILNMVRIASLSKKKKGKLLAAIEQKILDTMGGYIDSVDDEDLQLNMCEATLPINYEGSDYADDEDGFIEASVDGILAEYERKKSEKEVSDNADDGKGSDCAVRRTQHLLRHGYLHRPEPQRRDID